MKKTLKKLLSLGLAVTLAASMTACSSGTANETAAEAAGTEEAADTAGTDTGASGGAVFKIGGIGPITGNNAIYGEAVQNGTQLAIDEINAAGGINGAQVEFNFQDDEGDTEKAVNAYNTL